MCKNHQSQVAAFVNEHSLEMETAERLLDLVSEVGELSKEWLKATQYGRRTTEPGSDWRGELGDVYFALICLANQTGVDLEQVLQQALQKYRKRLEQRGEAGSGS